MGIRTGFTFVPEFLKLGTSPFSAFSNGLFPANMSPLFRFCLPLLLLSASSVRGYSEETQDLPFRDPDRSLEKRVDDLLSRLTVDEKIGQTMMSSPAIPRLGIPKYDWWNEALHGVARNGTATVFPQAIGLAATWNPELHRRIAEAISTEARAKNNEMLSRSGGDSGRYEGLTIWSPNINIFRDPRWGRGQETYGEDPFLTGRLAVAFVRGLQGEDPKYLKTVATVKHFAVHSGPEPDRHHFDARVSERDLRETYLPAFEAGIREGGAVSLMSAYNAVNGIPAPVNRTLLGEILRGEWGFSGAVVGDVDNVSDLWREGGHGYAKDPSEASAAALKAGNDLCSGGTYQGLREALSRGLVSEAEIDGALRRLFGLRFRLGQFDPPERVPYRAIPFSQNDSPEHDRLALEAARQSLVLLKNDGTLPWNPKELKTVAILGPTGGESAALLGNYSGTPSRKCTLTDGLRAKFEALGIRVLSAPAVPLVKGFRVSGQPFPMGVLFADAGRSRPGLKCEIFANDSQDPKKPRLEGRLVAERTDAQVDFQWDEAMPLPDIPVVNAGLRWSGVLVPPESGDYVLGVLAEGAVRVYLDDKAVIDSWRKEAGRPLSAPVVLEKGRTYRLRLDYVQLAPRGRIQFGWVAPGADDSLARALDAARQADHIVLTLGLTPDLEGESMRVTAEGFNGGDRTNLDLPATQRDLLERVAALGKPTVVVLTSGSALSFDEGKANAFLLCWYYGQRGADAVAEALVGETNPSGRLPITFYRSVAELPPFSDYGMADRTYRYFKGKPLYAFGYGLSYTTFSYERLALSKKTMATGGSVRVSVDVKNTGPRAGDEVVQLYVSFPKAAEARPLRQLVGFARISLLPGESKTVEIDLPAERLRRWDESLRRYVVDPGSYRIGAGPSSDNLPLLADLEAVAVP